MKPLDAKYNPGPWEVIDYYYKTYVKNVSEIVAQLPGCGGKFRANADLISAAPELLECLKEAVLEYGCGNCIEQGDREVDCPYFERESWRCSYDSECFGQQWMAAIRKAEGIK